MTVSFASASCEVVKTEIVARLKGTDGWQDPHNRGTYALLETESSQSSSGRLTIRGLRVTGDGKYTDKFGFNLMPIEDGKGCELSACSQSQVLSVLDDSTNYCNLRSLYCNPSDGCEIVYAELVYKEKYLNCWQRKAENCITAPSSEL